MDGVDGSEQYIWRYCFLRKSSKWWPKLFFWGMEISMVNSYLFFIQEKTKIGEKPVSHFKFLKTFIEQYIAYIARNGITSIYIASDEI